MAARKSRFVGLTKSLIERSSATDKVTMPPCEAPAMGTYEWLAREKLERAVRVKRPREDVCCGVSVRRARMINRARGEAIHEQYDVTPRHVPRPLGVNTLG